MRLSMIVFAMLWIGRGSSFAQQPAPNVKTAQDFSDKGKKAYNLGRFDEATELFSKAYEAWPQPEYLYNIAQSYRLGGNCKQALYLYKRFRSLKDQDTTDPLSQKKKDDIEKFIGELTECAMNADRSANVPLANPPDDHSAAAAAAANHQHADDHEGEAPTGRGTKGHTAALEPKGDKGEDEAVTKEQPSAGAKLVVARLTGGMALISAGDLGIPVQPMFGFIGGYPIHIAPVTIEVGAALSYTPLPYAVMGRQKRGMMLGFRAAGIASYPVMPKLSVRGNLGLGVLSLSRLEAGNPISTGHKAGSFMLPSIGLGVAVDYEFVPSFVATVSPLNIAFSPGVDGMYASSLREIDVVIGIGYRQ